MGCYEFMLQHDPFPGKHYTQKTCFRWAILFHNVLYMLNADKNDQLYLSDELLAEIKR